jgi:peroxidase
MVHRESSDDTLSFTMMVMQWGQYIDHDLTSTPQSRGFNNSIIKCCSEDGKPLSPELMHPDCAPIQIPTTDPFYSQFNVTCMEFIRSSPAPRKDCSLGPRDPINQVTSFLDASSIYGSTIEEQKALRLGRIG